MKFIYTVAIGCFLSFGNTVQGAIDLEDLVRSKQRTGGHGTESGIHCGLCSSPALSAFCPEIDGALNSNGGHPRGRGLQGLAPGKGNAGTQASLVHHASNSPVWAHLESQDPGTSPSNPVWKQDPDKLTWDECNVGNSEACEDDSVMTSSGTHGAYQPVPEATALAVWTALSFLGFSVYRKRSRLGSLSRD